MSPRIGEPTLPLLIGSVLGVLAGASRGYRSAGEPGAVIAPGAGVFQASASQTFFSA